MKGLKTLLDKYTPDPADPIADNREHGSAADRLNEGLAGAAEINAVAGYFSVHGYEALAEALDAAGRVNLVLGSLAGTAARQIETREAVGYRITERGIEPSRALRLRGAARRCADWLRKASVAVKGAPNEDDRLHGKLYQALAADGRPIFTVVGSSNLTAAGMGGAAGEGNVETNTVLRDPADGRAWRTGSADGGARAWTSRRR